MSDHSARPFFDSEATSGTPSRAHQSSWMSHWMKRGPKPASVVDNHSSLVCYKNGDIDTRLKIEDNFPMPFKGLGKEVVDEMVPQTVNENVTKKTGDFLNKINHSPSVSVFNACHNKPHMDDDFGDKAMSLALSLGKEEIVKNFDALKKNHLRKIEKRPMGSNTDLRLSTSSHFAPHRTPINGDSSSSGGPLVVFERHFSNDNFTCLGQGHCKYQKFSTFMFHEKKTNNNEHNSLEPRQSDENKKVNFLPFSPKGRSEKRNTQGNRAPRAVRNVETMRICTMVDSVENSPGGSPKIISQRAHHFLFTKETCVNMSEEKLFGSSPRVQGVKIQPLWTSTDSEEKENTGNNPSTCKAESRNDDEESSAESEPIEEIKAPENQHTAMFGLESSAVKKDGTLDSSTAKARSKRPINEIPDINEELLGLKPAASSTDITESSSRVHSFDTKKLFFPCGEQNAQNAPPLGPDDGGTSRWIKRLKSSDSSGIGTRSSNPLEEASSSHEKFSLFLNKIMKSSKTMLSEPQGKFVGPDSLVGPSKKNQAMVLGGSWIQRWCRNPTTTATTTATTTNQVMRNHPEPLVICEPHTLKFNQEELSKKQFPSIAAMALMGKAMNGFRPCEFRKMGPVVVWKVNEY